MENKKLTIKKININLFKDFLNKLISTNNVNVFIKLNKDYLTSHIYEGDYNAVKLVRVNTVDIFEFSKPLTSNVLLVFSDGRLLLKELSLFDESTTLTLNGFSDSDETMTVTSVTFKSDIDKSSLNCMDIRYSFNDVDDNRVDQLFDLEVLSDAESFHKLLGSFIISSDTIQEMKKRLKLRSDSSKFALQVNNTNVLMVTENREFLLTNDFDILSTEFSNVSIYTKYLNYLDNDSYNVLIASDRIIFESVSSDSKLGFTAIEDGGDLDELDELDSLDLENLDSFEIEY